MTAEAEHYMCLQNMSNVEAAEMAVREGLHVVIDLNGLTRNTGLRIMAHRMAPLQVSLCVCVCMCVYVCVCVCACVCTCVCTCVYVIYTHVQ